MRIVLAAAASLAAVTGAQAQVNNNNGFNNNPYSYTNQTYSYGLYLPQVPQPTGQDEVRAADGTSCRSSMASNDAYLDVGAIGSQGYGGDFDQGTFYGRMIIPLGTVPSRVDCGSLYNLEIQRLQNELALVRAGLGSEAAVASAPAASAPLKLGAPTVPPRGAAKKDAGWAEKGWSTSGWKDPSKVGAAAVAVPPPAQVPAAMPAPQAAFQPTGSISPVAPPATPVAMPAAATVEYLPWSTVPALGDRAVVLGKAPAEKSAALVVPRDDTASDITMRALGGFY